MIVGVVGSREGFSYESIKYELDTYKPTITKIVTGGASGVDSFVDYYCDRTGIELEVIRPLNYEKYGKLGYLYRNVEIITKSDMIIAFWNGESKGTKFVIEYARARDKIVQVICVEKN